MYGLPDNQLQKLQVIQNAAARLVTRTKQFESISPILRALHWLPIRSRIAFKILLLTYQCFHEMAPSYLSELLVRYEPGRSLRSSQRDLYVVPPISTNFYGKRSFRACRPRTMERHPESYKTCGYYRRVQDIFNILPFQKVMWCVLYNDFCSILLF